MAIALFNREDKMPFLERPAQVRIEKSFDVRMLHHLTGLSKMEIERRFMEQNDAWVLWVKDIPAAFGWVAHVFAPIGELERFVQVGDDEVYLWNFRTVEQWRGKGLYPLLLQHILRAQLSQGTRRHWIIAKPENRASVRGIQKAGFEVVGELSYDRFNELVLVPVRKGESTDDAASFLDVRIAGTDIAPCWCCSSPAMAHSKNRCECQCALSAADLCTC